MYYAIYARSYAGEQVMEGASLEEQIQSGIKKAQELGAKDEEIKIYQDKGSGEDIDTRPEMTRMRTYIANGLIDYVIIQHPDILSSDLTEKLIAYRDFQKNGVELVFSYSEFCENSECGLFVNMVSSIAAYELALSKKRNTKGRLQAVKEEKKIMPMRVPPYGYDLIEGKLIINEQEADFVRKIYEWYIYDNLTLREIGGKLHELGAIPKRKESNNWGTSSISRILTNEIYIGRYYYNRRKSREIAGEKTSSGNPKKIFDMRNPEEWVMVEVPRIIDESMFEMAQTQKEKNAKKSGNMKYNYLLKGLIKCNCGKTWQATTYSGRLDKETGMKKKYFVYRCPNEVHKQCKNASIHAIEFEEYIWYLIVETLLNTHEHRTYLAGESREVGDDLQSQIEYKQNQLVQKEKQKDKIKLLFFEDLISWEEMKTDMQKVNADIKKINEEINEFRNRILIKTKQEKTEDRLNEIIFSVHNLLKAEELSFKEKQNITHKLIDEIQVEFGESNKVNIKIMGALGKIINQKVVDAVKGVVKRNITFNLLLETS